MSDLIKDVLEDKKLEDLQVVVKAGVVAEPKLTTEKIEQAIVLLKEVEKNNGHIAIAQAVGLSQEQVALIHEKMLEKIAELTVSDMDVEPVKK
jgi:hypothetical protein